jgi:hypothetical protein
MHPKMAENDCRQQNISKNSFGNKETYRNAKNYKNKFLQPNISANNYI